MPVRFSSEDLGRVFESDTIIRGRTLLLRDCVEVTLDGETILGSVRDGDIRHAV